MIEPHTPIWVYGVLFDIFYRRVYIDSDKKL